MTSRWWFYPALIAVSLFLVAAGVAALTVVLLASSYDDGQRHTGLELERLV